MSDLAVKPLRSQSVRDTPNRLPKRKPLQEQSNSEANAYRSASPASDHSTPAYSKTAFPRLASQEFLPQKPQTADSNRSLQSRPRIPARSPLRRHNTNSSSNLRGSALASSIRAVDSEVPSPGPPEAIARPLPSIPDAYEELRQSTHELLLLTSDFEIPRPDAPEIKDVGAKVNQPEQAADAEEELANVTIRPRRNAPRSTVRASVASSASSETLAPGERLGGFHIDRLPSITSQPPSDIDRALHTPNLDPPPPVGLWPGFDGGSGSTNDHRIERRRSASSPVIPSDVFLQSLQEGTLPLQYPKLRQPSGLCLRADTSPTQAEVDTFKSGTVYPQPLQIRRKRAVSNFSRTASIQHTGSLVSASVPPASTIARTFQGRNGSARSGMTTSSSDIARTRRLGSASPDPPEKWIAELDDTVSELHSHGVQTTQQRSLFRPETPSKSRPASNSSSTSHFGSFYTFFNDSVTNFARYAAADLPFVLES